LYSRGTALYGRLDIEEPKTTALQILTASHTTQISSNDTDITALHGRLDIEEPKTTALQILTSSHITQISSNDTDITALQGRLDIEEPKTTALQILTSSHTTNISTNTANILTKQATITDGSLTIARTNGLQTALNGKQATITDGSLTIARTNGLQTALNGKQATITDGSLTIARTNGLQTALDGKQATITDGSLTIARTNGLQTALDGKQATIDTSTDLTCNQITTKLGNVGSTNSINGFEFTRPFSNNIRLNSGFDNDGVKTAIISYNRNSGTCIFNAKSQLILQAGDVLSNIQASGFKIGASISATEALDVAGNILASGSLTAGSVIVGSTNIITVSSGKTGFNGVAGIDFKLEDITLANIQASGFKIGASTPAQEALDLAGNILVSGTIIASGVSIITSLTDINTTLENILFRLDALENP
jgi:hypothetical protein